MPDSSARRKRSRPLFRLALLLAGLAAGGAVRAQEPSSPPAEPAPDAGLGSDADQTLRFPAEVEQVVVDVVVTDKKGVPVRGLTADDFQVLEDGVPQHIVSFDPVELPDQPRSEPLPTSTVSVNTNVAEQRGRTFVILFDDLSMPPWKVNPSKAAVASFLRNGVREGDRVALVSTSGSVWWSARMESGRDGLLDIVKRLDGRYIPETGTDRISDWEAFRIHVYRDPMVYARVFRRFQTWDIAFTRSQTGNVLDQEMIEDPYITQRAAETYYKAVARLHSTLGVMERAIDGLVDVEGRKSVILISDGFIYDPSREEFKRVNEAARRANAVVYFVNSRGLEGMPATMTAEFGGVMPDQDVGMAFVDSVDAVAGSEDIATRSGGFVVSNTNDLASGIQRIARETLAYYLLGYVSTNTARDGEFREIEVKLANGKGRNVRARKGYYAPSGTGELTTETRKGVDPVIQSALDSPWSRDDIPLRMTHYVGDERASGKAVALVATEVDIRALDLEEKDGRWDDTLEFLLVVAHRETGEFFRYDQSIVMDMLPETRQRVEREWLPIVRDFELRPGDYQAKIVVRDKRSGKVGTVIHDFAVPPLDDLRVSTPVLSDALAREQKPEGAPGARLDVIVRREFPVGSTLYCQIDVFGAERDTGSGMPRVVQSYVVRRADGNVFTSGDPSEIHPTSLGALSRVSGFSLRGAPPGDYEIVMDVRDEIAGKSVELREPFRVVPAAGAAAPMASTGR